MTNPLVVDEPRSGLLSGATNDDAAHGADGAGLFYDGYTTITDLSSGNWVGAGIDVAGDALDTLSFVTDPLQGLLSAGIGWLIEHVSFLSEPLDYLAGDAGLVQDKAQTWKNIQAALEKGAEDYSQSAQGLLQSYTGAAATAYAASATNFAGQTKGAAAHAGNAATAITVAAAIVGTTRGLVRDWISAFVSQAIEKWAIAAATSWLDFGASLGIFIADEVVEGSILAEKTTSKLSEIAAELSRMAEHAGEDGAKVAKTASSIEKDAARMTKTAQHTLSDADSGVKAASATARQAFKAAEKAGFTGTKGAEALAKNRSLTHDLQGELADATTIKSAAESAAHNAGTASTGLENTARQAGKNQRSIEAEIDKLAEERRTIVGSRIGPKTIENSENAAKERAIDGLKGSAKGLPVETARQATTERDNRAGESSETQNERVETDGEIRDGSVVGE